MKYFFIFLILVCINVFSDEKTEKNEETYDLLQSQQSSSETLNFSRAHFFGVAKAQLRKCDQFGNSVLSTKELSKEKLDVFIRLPFDIESKSDDCDLKKIQEDFMDSAVRSWNPSRATVTDAGNKILVAPYLKFIECKHAKNLESSANDVVLTFLTESDLNDYFRIMKESFANDSSDKNSQEAGKSSQVSESDLFRYKIVSANKIRMTWQSEPSRPSAAQYKVFLQHCILRCHDYEIMGASLSKPVLKDGEISVDANSKSIELKFKKSFY